MRDLPPGLGRKADQVLVSFGGLKGMAEQPLWLMTIVLKTFFAEDEAKSLLDYLRSGRSAVEYT